MKIPTNPFEKLLDGKIKPFKEFEGDFHRAIWESIQQTSGLESMDQIEHNVETENMAGVTYYDTRRNHKIRGEEAERDGGTLEGLKGREERTKKQDRADKTSDQISYSKIYRFLATLVATQPEPLQRLRSQLNDAQKSDLNKLLRVEEETMEVSDEDEDAVLNGENKKRRPKETDLDRLLRLIHILRIGHWRGRLSRRLDSNETALGKNRDGESAMTSSFTDSNESFAREIPDFPFAILFDEIVRLVDSDPAELLKLKEAFESVEIRETLDYVPSQEKIELDRLLALLNQVIESGWQSEWTLALLAEEEERRKMEAERKRIATAARKSRKLQQKGEKKFDLSKIPVAEHIGGTEFKKTPIETAPEKPVKAPELDIKPTVPSPKVSPVSGLLRTLTKFMQNDRENTIEMLCLQPKEKARLLEIIEEDNPIDNDPGREARDLAKFQETLQILATGEWQHRALIQFSHRRHAAWLRYIREQRQREAAMEKAEESRFRFDDFGRKVPICPSKAKGLSFEEPVVISTNAMEGKHNVGDKEDYKFRHREALPKCRKKIGAVKKEKFGAVEKEKKRQVSPIRLWKTSARSAGLPLLPDHPVLRIFRSLYIPSLQIADKEEEESGEFGYEDNRQEDSTFSTGFVRDQIMERFGTYE